MASSDSPSDQTAAPNRTISLSRNCPGIPERAGKPSVGSHPGVEMRKESVVANSPIARTLPIADALGETERRLMSTAVAFSLEPNIVGNDRTLRIPDIQAESGL